MNVFVTGPYGFVGAKLCQQLSKLNHSVIACTRSVKADGALDKSLIEITYKDAPSYLGDVDVCVHLAARTHVMQETDADPYEAYAEVNVHQTISLARQALQANVKRFIFISSVKVLGETSYNQPFTEHDACRPEDDYGKTKLEAEQSLIEIFKHTETELVIIRPPLIYGEGVKANFKSLISLCKKNLPLPFGAIQNNRSLIYMENLVNFILLCCQHPKAANETFLISDDEDVSTSQLILSIKKGLNKKPLLLPVPQKILTALLRALGKKALVARLCGDLQVDISKAKKLLNWQPLYDFQEGINRTVKF